MLLVLQANVHTVLSLLKKKYDISGPRFLFLVETRLAGILDEEQTPSLLRFASQSNVPARLDLIQTLNSALNDMVCYVCIVWDVAN